MQIADDTQTDYPSVLAYARSDRLVFLQRVRSVLVRAHIVEQYALIDEILSTEVAKYFFRGENWVRMWKRSQKFANFNYFVLEKLSVRDKLGLVKDVRRIPKAVSQRIEQIAAIRNVVAHALFPENLRAAKGKVNQRGALVSFPYKGTDVFTPEGLKRFREDVEVVTKFFDVTKPAIQTEATAG
jgi:hypothetical protein